MGPFCVGSRNSGANTVGVGCVEPGRQRPCVVGRRRQRRRAQRRLVARRRGSFIKSHSMAFTFGAAAPIADHTAELSRHTWLDENPESEANEP